MIPVILAVMIIMSFLIRIINEEFQIVESFSDLRSIDTSQSWFSGSLPFLFVLLANTDVVYDFILLRNSNEP